MQIKLTPNTPIPSSALVAKSPLVGDTGSLIERPSEQRLRDSKSHHISNGTELNHLAEIRRHYSARRRARREPEGCHSIFVFAKT